MVGGGNTNQRIIDMTMTLPTSPDGSGSLDIWEDQTRRDTCVSCGIDLGPMIVWDGKELPTRCTPCSNKDWLEHLRGKNNPDNPRATWQAQLQSFARFAEIDVAWMLHHNPELQNILQWQPNAHGYGLYISGISGSGKTNTMLKLFDRLVQQTDKRAHWIRSIELARTFSNASRGDGNVARKLLRDLRYSDILYIDDLGQEVITKRFKEGLFEILDYRIDRRIPTFFTSNYHQGELLGRFEGASKGQDGTYTVDGQGALVRRLFQVNHQLHLAKPLPSHYTPLP